MTEDDPAVRPRSATDALCQGEPDHRPPRTRTEPQLAEPKARAVVDQDRRSRAVG